MYVGRVVAIAAVDPTTPGTRTDERKRISHRVPACTCSMLLKSGPQPHPRRLQLSDTRYRADPVRQSHRSAGRRLRRHSTRQSHAPAFPCGLLTSCVRDPCARRCRCHRVRWPAMYQCQYPTRESIQAYGIARDDEGVRNCRAVENNGVLLSVLWSTAVEYNPSAGSATSAKRRAIECDSGTRAARRDHQLVRGQRAANRRECISQFADQTVTGSVTALPRPPSLSSATTLSTYVPASATCAQHWCRFRAKGPTARSSSGTCTRRCTRSVCLSQHPIASAPWRSLGTEDAGDGGRRFL